MRGWEGRGAKDSKEAKDTKDVKADAAMPVTGDR
jgi:hypothetical protein